MPAPRSRRMRSAPPEPEVADDFAPDDADVAGGEGLEFAEDQYQAESVAAADPPPSSASSRRAGARRSSRRAASSSSSRRSSRRQATPEERAARRRAFMLVVKLLLSVSICGGLAYGFWYVALRTPEHVAVARNAIAHAEGLSASIDRSLQIGDPRAANQQYDEAQGSMAEAEPAFIDSPNLAERAEVLKSKLQDLRPRIERLERDQQVQSNLARLTAGFGRMRTLDDAALVNLEKDTNQFLENPVAPDAGRNDTYIKDYAVDMASLRQQLIRIKQERDRRTAMITDLPVREALMKSETLVKQELFRDALALVDEQQRQFPTADFAPVREFVQGAAREAWQTANTYAEENYKTATAPGTSEALRKSAIENSQRRMQQVIERFGIDDYVNQATAALERYRTK